MDKLGAMQIFAAVARAGGFSAAARALDMPVPTVSRRVAELEAELGVRLFDRSTRQVVLTSAATAYLASCIDVIDNLRVAESVVKGEHQQPRGELTVTAPAGFGRLHVHPVAVEFLKEFPEIDLRLQFTDRIVNLLEDQVDLAIRISTLQDSRLVARQLGETRVVVCASPEYLERRGTPTHPSELVDHDCVAWSSLGPSKAWLFNELGADSLFPVRVRLMTTLPESAVDAAVSGLGIVQVTSHLAAEAVRAGRLVPLLQTFERAPTPVSLVYASSRLVPQKLRAFLDFSTERFVERLRAIAEVF